MTINLAQALRLMLVTDDALLAGRDLSALVQAAVSGGVTSVQVRLKLATARELVEVTRRLMSAVEIPVFVNDRPDVALAAGAAGVHLGEDDLSVHAVRRITPAGFLIGASVGASWEAARGAGADYWGVGPFCVTSTKADAGEAIGVAGVRAVTALPDAPPCVAIGGVRAGDLPALRDVGVQGVAVVSGILGAADPQHAAAQYSAAWTS